MLSDKKELPLVVESFPIVAKAVFGQTPQEILKETKGRPAHLYYSVYLCVLGLYVLFFAFVGLFITPEVFQQFLVDEMITNFGFLGVDSTNFIVPVFGIFALCVIAIVIISVVTSKIIYKK